MGPNHTVTHILNSALRTVLGDSVEQRGSLCNDEKLRFDFSHKKAMNVDQVVKTEKIVRKIISEAQEVKDEIIPLEDAKKIDGVRAVFGEVYPDPVRVVSVGGNTSVEFCGGTHITNTKEAEAFVLVEETAVAKGIRRITGITKELAKQAIVEGEKFEKQVEEAESSTSISHLEKTANELRKSVDAAYISDSLKTNLRGRIEKLQKKVVQEKKAALAKRVDVVLNDVREKIAGALESNQQSLVLDVDIEADSKASQKVMNVIKEIAPEIAFMGISEENVGSGGKVLCFAIVPKALNDVGLQANEWVKETLSVVGGRGGGKPGNAQGQAQSCEDLNVVITAGSKFAAAKLN